MADIGWVRQSLAELVQQLRTDLLTSLSQDEVLRRDDLEVQARVQAAAWHTVNGFIEFLALEILPDTATAWLERHGNWRKVFRKPPTQATGPATLLATTGGVFPADTVIPDGTRLQRSGIGDYVTVGDTPAIGSSVVVQVRAVDAGAAGNAVAGTRLSLVSPIAGVQSVVTAGELSGGADIEDIEAYRARIRDFDSKDVSGGNPDDYEGWVKETPGVNVSQVWVYRNSLGDDCHGITFIVDGRDDFIPTAEDVAAVQAHVDGKRPAGAEPFVFMPIAVPQAHTIDVTPDTPAIRAAVEAELRDFYRREAQPAGVIRGTRREEAISVAAGESWHQTTAPVGDVVLTAGHIATFGSITWV